MTWIVATISILFIMIIFLFASGVFRFKSIGDVLNLFKGKDTIGSLNFPEQQQSVFALSEYKEIKDAIISENYNQAENLINPILERITEYGYHESKGGWNVQIFKNNKQVKRIEPMNIPGHYDKQNFFTNLKSSDFSIRLFLESKSENYMDKFKNHYPQPVQAGGTLQ